MYNRTHLMLLRFTKILSILFAVMIWSHATGSSEKAFAQQTGEPTSSVGLTLSDYLERVMAGNFELMIEGFEITAAEAAVTAARVFEDPELEIILPNFERDEFSGAPANIAFELEIPVELGRKRARRIELARAEYSATRAGFEDFLRTFRADASRSYIAALRQQQVLSQMEETLEQLAQLVDITVQLFEAGEISEIEVLQTRIEARNFESEFLSEKSEMEELLQELYLFLGGIPDQPLYFTSELDTPLPADTMEELVQNALLHRSDLQFLARSVQVRESELRLARAERIPTINIVAGYHNEEAIVPMPRFRAAYAGIQIPLQFSGLNRGAIREQQAFLDQSVLDLEYHRLMATSEIRSSFNKMMLAAQNKTLFTEGILEDALRVRDAVIYSYQRGEITLLEVLDAQRTYNELFMNFYDAASDYINSVIDLSEKSGVWLLELE